MINAKGTFVDRRDRALLTPEYEDSGLFKSAILQMNVALTPLVFRNARKDLIVHCYNDAANGFEVTFAGRRSLMAAPLIANLEALQSEAVKQRADATDSTDDLSPVRIPITVEGAWRKRFWTDPDGWLSRVHQFVAARWFVAGEADRVIAFGTAPAVKPMGPIS